MTSRACVYNRGGESLAVGGFDEYEYRTLATLATLATRNDAFLSLGDNSARARGRQWARAGRRTEGRQRAG